MSDDGSRTTRHTRLSPLIWPTLALLPFLYFPLAHHVQFGNEATGLTTYDLPYYAANARALAERGHSGLYPNPFDPASDSPAIYSHWLITTLAILTHGIGLDPGFALLLIGLVGGWLAARVMFALVAALVDDPQLVPPLYLSTMWGGGLLITGQISSNIVHGQPWNETLLALDPGNGLWCLNFGRNLILPTEAVYHALMIGLWLTVMRSQWRIAALLLWLIVTTHPFTGAQALAILTAYIAVDRLIALRSSRSADDPAASIATVPVAFIANTVIAGLAFVAYYFLFLPSHSSHRELQETWTLSWSLTTPMILLAYTPAALTAALAVSRDAAWRTRCRFLITAATVSFLLANHHWFITPHQPIHFTRGYIWTPLWLAGLPVIASLCRWGMQPNRRWASVVVAALAMLLVSDNAGFLITSGLHARDYGFTLNAAERAAFNAISQLEQPGTLLTDDERLGYLSAVYTPARPYFGHRYNTPQFDARKQLAQQLVEGVATSLPPEIDLVLTQSPYLHRLLESQAWLNVGTAHSFSLWRRPPLAGNW